VRWYLRYALSLRDVEELLAERGMGHCCTKAKGVLARHSALVRFSIIMCAQNRSTPRLKLSESTGP